MKPPVRIAVLECDTPIDKIKDRYGGFGTMFQGLLERGAHLFAEKGSHDVPELDVTKYDVVNAEMYPSLDSIDAVLITGSSEFLVVSIRVHVGNALLMCYLKW